MSPCAAAPKPSSGPAFVRYRTLLQVAAGGMATVFVGLLTGDFGFWRLVAIKRPHPYLLDQDPRFSQMLVHEAQLASQIQHPNVVAVRDVVRADGTLFLIMDYVEGASLAELLAVCEPLHKRLRTAVALRIVLDACAGLHAAHELTDQNDQPLGLVHRDVSPQNILVGLDGLARMTDFGLAQCVRGGGHEAPTGTLEGKFAYMAPEYIGAHEIDRRADVFSMGVVTWEALAGERLFQGANVPDTMHRVLHESAPPIAARLGLQAPGLDAVLGRALDKAPARRFESVQSFALALEEVVQERGLIASAEDVSQCVLELVGEKLQERRTQIRAELERAEAPGWETERD